MWEDAYDRIQKQETYTYNDISRIYVSSKTGSQTGIIWHAKGWWDSTNKNQLKTHEELAELMAYTAESIVFGYFGLTAVAYTSEVGMGSWGTKKHIGDHKSKKLAHRNLGFPHFFFCNLPSLKTNSSPLKMDGWKMILSFWVSAYFQGLLLLVSGRVKLKISKIKDFGELFADFLSHGHIVCIYMICWIYPALNNSLKWLFTGMPEPKNVTVTGWGVYPNEQLKETVG